MDPWELLPAMLLADLGIGAALAPLTTLAMAAVDSRHAGPASGVLNTSRQIGGILGGAAVGALITRQTTSAATPSAGSGHATGAATAAADYASALHTTTLLTTGVLFLAAISAAALAPAAGLPRRQRPRRTAFLRLDTLPVVVHGSHGYGAVQILTAIRVGARGRREVIGFELAGSDASASWSRLLTGLHSRGLASIRHVVCGEAPGLSAAVAAVLRLPTRPASAAHDPAAQLRRTLRHHLDTDGPACTRAGLAATVQEAIAVQNSRWATPPRPRRRLRRPSASP